MRRLHKKTYDQSESEKMYNIGFHPIMLYIFPSLWLYSLPINFLVDSIVLLIGFKVFGKEKVWFNWKKSILLSWIFGYVADVAAAFLLLFFEYIAGSVFKTDIFTDKFGGGIVPIIANLISVAFAGILIYILNEKVALRRTELDDKTRKKVALLMAIVTAPYFFFMPVVF